MRISDWSSDVCSSDLHSVTTRVFMRIALLALASGCSRKCDRSGSELAAIGIRAAAFPSTCSGSRVNRRRGYGSRRRMYRATAAGRSEEHTSELQSLMRISYAVFCLKKTPKIYLTHGD